MDVQGAALALVVRQNNTSLRGGDRLSRQGRWFTVFALQNPELDAKVMSLSTGEPRGHTLKRLKDLFLHAKARIWP